MMKRVFMPLLLLAVISLGAMAITRKPVLFSLADVGEASGQPVLAVMNPFRDRAPERAAEAVLTGLQRGDTEHALSLVDGGVPTVVHTSEKRYRLRSWKLVRRTDSSTSVELVYRTSRSANDRVVMPLFVHVRKADDRWRVTRFIVAY
jgi:hypothetical protein